MDQYAQRITRDYPVRRKAQEKENMRTYLMGQLRALGYDAKLNDCGKAVNVIAAIPSGRASSMPRTTIRRCASRCRRSSARRGR